MISPTCIMISPTVPNTPMVLKITPMLSRYPHGTEHPHRTQDIPTVLKTPHGTQDIPHGTHDIPTVLNTPHGTETPHGTAHTLYRVFISCWVRRTYVFTLQEVEEICRTLQNHVMQVWTMTFWLLAPDPDKAEPLPVLRQVAGGPNLLNPFKPDVHSEATWLIPNCRHLAQCASFLL